MIGILSDAHGNWRAFDKGVSVLKHLGATRFVFLGDALGYLPLTTVLDSIESLGHQIVCVRGNHEDMILNKDVITEEALYQHARARTKLSASQLVAISTWPTIFELEVPAGKAVFIHGSPSAHTYGYVYPDTDLRQFEVSAKYVFMGNTHRPFIRTEAGVKFVNVGSCGLPRDHGSLGAAVLFDEQDGDCRIFRFDIRQATIDSLAEVSEVHKDVLDIFSRQAIHIEGERFAN